MKIKSLQALIESGNFTEVEIREFTRWLLTNHINMPTQFTLAVLRGYGERSKEYIDTAANADHLKSMIFADEYISGEIDEFCASWCYLLINWEWVFTQLKAR